MSQGKKKGKWDSSDDESDGEVKKKRTKVVQAQTEQHVEITATIESELPIKEDIITSINNNTIENNHIGTIISSPIKEIEPVEVLDERDDVNISESPVPVEVPVLPIPRVHNPIFDGCRSVDCYQRINFIDQGTYGMVFKAKCRETGDIYALKQIKFGPETSKVGFPITALREINILLALQHPNIVRVKEMVVGSSIDKIYMVMEYCENDLKTCMKMSKQSFSTAEVRILIDYISYNLSIIL